jgi:BlaI family penicillinase repressor
MDEAAARITTSELEVLRVLWAEHGPLTITEIKATLKKTSKWNGDTIKTLLRRLCEKGAVEQEKREVYCYRPLVTEEEYGRYSTQTIIDKLYSGSAKNLIAALVKNDQLRSEDIEELHKLLKAGESGE